jgi:chemotaxis protein CheD
MDSTGIIIEVGMADMKMAVGPAVIVTRGLGSCLGVVLYDSMRKVAALAHPMLPKIDEGRVKSNPYKFVDSAIKAMIEEFKKKGCQPCFLHAKIFGGAHMFSSIPINSVFNIGARNAEVAREIFSINSVKLIAEDIGGNSGRTIFVDTATGQVAVKTLFHGEKIV